MAIGRDLVAGILTRLKSHPALAALIVGGMGLVGLGEVIGALNQLLDFTDSRLLRSEGSQPHSGKLEIVFCRLPQSRRPFITISRNCNDRGGEALVFEPANFAVALGWWAPLAEEGDPEAQTYIGEFYEQGLAGSPDYATAAKWYQRAAEQGHATAQVRLALLYERGLGVEKDSLKAAELRLEVERNILRVEERGVVQALESLDNSRQDLLQQQAVLQAADAGGDTEASARLEQIEQRLMELEQRFQSVRMKEADVAARSETEDGELWTTIGTYGQPVRSIETPVRSYYALVISNGEYGRGLTDLWSAHADGEVIAQILNEVYSYEVFVLKNASRTQTLDALNVYRANLTDSDNLLIYYTGHSLCESDNDERGYWLPVDAEPYPYTTNWISLTDLTDIIDGMEAHHVLLLADACFPGALSEPAPVLTEVPHRDAYIDLLKGMANQPARLIMTSSGSEPIADTRGIHSIFAGALIETLGTNREILPARRLFVQMVARVNDAARLAGFIQRPTYRLIKSDRHQGGDFLFVPPELPNS